MVVGVLYRGKNEAGEIPKLWDKLMEKDIEARDDNVHAAYGISIMNEDYEKTKVFDYIAGFAVSGAAEMLPEGMAKFTIPEGQYAVITCPNLQSIGKAYGAIYRWVDNAAEYTYDFSAGNFNFEYYGEEFMPPESERFYIYVPVKAK